MSPRCSDAAAPRYDDFLHVLFKCAATCEAAGMAEVREACKSFLPQLCEFIDAAVRE